MMVVRAAATKGLLKRFREAVVMIRTACRTVAVAWARMQLRIDRWGTGREEGQLRGVLLLLRPRRLGSYTSWSRMRLRQMARTRLLVARAATVPRSCMELIGGIGGIAGIGRGGLRHRGHAKEKEGG